MFKKPPPKIQAFEIVLSDVLTHYRMVNVNQNLTLFKEIQGINGTKS